MRKPLLRYYRFLINTFSVFQRYALAQVVRGEAWRASRLHDVFSLFDGKPISWDTKIVVFNVHTMAG